MKLISLYSRILICFFLLPFSFFLFNGCSPKPEPQLSPSEALTKFNTLTAELKLSPVVRLAGQTLWIYLPLKERLMDVQADPSQTASVTTTPAAQEKPSLLFWDANFKDGIFNVQYDSDMVRAYGVSPGYKMNPSENMQKAQQNLLTALLRSFYDSEDRPIFVVFIITDIERGIEMENIFNFDDLKKASSMPPALPQDEYAKRFISLMKGDAAGIGDLTGKHLSWKEMLWEDFLSRQIKHRIGFKYQQSSFPPSDDAVQEVGRIARDTLAAYDFKNYEAVLLEDLATGQLFKLK